MGPQCQNGKAGGIGVPELAHTGSVFEKQIG